MVLRYLEKFVTADGADTYTFPLNGLEWEENQNVRTAYQSAIGADGAHDFLGEGIGPKENVKTTVRWIFTSTTDALVETNLAAVRSKLHVGALGKLWALDSDATRRWSRARIATVPKSTRVPGQLFFLPMSVSFVREPNWYSETGVIGEQRSTSNTQSVTITNAGNAYVKTGLVMSLEAQTVGGWDHPRITNETTGESVSSTRYAREVDAVWMMDNSDLSLQVSPDPGMVIGQYESYVGQAGVGSPLEFVSDYALAELGERQVGVISLAPGANTVILQNDGTPDYVFDFSYYAAWS